MAAKSFTSGDWADFSASLPASTSNMPPCETLAVKAWSVGDGAAKATAGVRAITVRNAAVRANIIGRP